jgi:hypothetical protein
MVEFNTEISDPLYLEDLHVGQRFTSRAHIIDEVQIKAFAHRSYCVTQRLAHK